jgi:histidine triad (HIT) family protein
MNSCIFLSNSPKAGPANLVYEDEKAMAFLDIRPLSEGHALIIPKSQYETIFDIPEELLMHIHGVTKRVALVVEKATHADGISIMQQNGKAAGQEILHLRVHVIPRCAGQKLPKFSEASEASKEKLNQTAARIRKHIW